ncbi:hypothetical protein SGL43_06167 [Streptomyces globisporus]|uniref:Uncharacterized protein n=1 Tax=Streptomyces globisporus TaxID=1908 RepID=A0ABM9H661_STRGL|nr:hypothetical protein SGL43_06167 [Streptomyces globisporus]
MPRGGEGSYPEVVLGREAQQVLVEVRETEIRHVVTHPPMFSVRGARGNLWCRTQAKRFRFAGGWGYGSGVRNGFVRC